MSTACLLVIVRLKSFGKRSFELGWLDDLRWSGICSVWNPGTGSEPRVSMTASGCRLKRAEEAIGGLVQEVQIIIWRLNNCLTRVHKACALRIQ